MNMNQAEKLLTFAIQAKRRILLVGPPGMGKTAIVKAAQVKTGADLTILYASISDPTDFKGFYCIIDGKPEIMPFGELEKVFNASRPHIVFLDDLGQGAPAVQAASMSFLDRLKDNPFVTVIAATNRREDRAGVSGLLEPVKSRFDSIIHLEFDMDSWIEWALTTDLPFELIAFNKFRPTLMYGSKATADLVNGASPRTVEALGRLMQLGLPPELEYEVYKGAVGEEYTAELMGFLPIWRKIPNIDQIMLDPQGTAIPAMSDKHAPSIYFAVCLALSKRANENTIGRIITFADRLPKEFAVSLIVDCVRQDAQVTNTKDYIGWISKNKDVLI